MLLRRIWLLLVITIVFLVCSGCGPAETITTPVDAIETVSTLESDSELEPTLLPSPESEQTTAAPRVTEPELGATEIPATETAPPQATNTETPPVTEQPEATATANLMVNDLSLSAEGITLFPVPAIYEGDLVT